jgi:glycosyltransferase involved in cell wall biosynthesis
VRDHLKDWLPPERSVRVSYNALPDAAVPWTGSGEAEKRLLCLGRLTPKKGVMILLEALAKLGPGGWTLDVVGDGPMSGELASRAAELGIDGSVRFQGYSDDASRRISKCDLFLFPSLDEGMGLSLAEALSSGAPLLSSDIPSVREIASLAEERLLPPGDANAWARAIGRFLEGKLEGAAKLSVKLPDAEEMARKVVDFYGDVLNRPGADPSIQ